MSRRELGCNGFSQSLAQLWRLHAKETEEPSKPPQGATPLPNWDNPYKVHVKKGAYYGRGVADAKASLLMAIQVRAADGMAPCLSHRFLQFTLNAGEWRLCMQSGALGVEV